MYIVYISVSAVRSENRNFHSQEIHVKYWFPFCPVAIHTPIFFRSKCQGNITRTHAARGEHAAHAQKKFFPTAASKYWTMLETISKRGALQQASQCTSKSSKSRRWLTVCWVGACASLDELTWINLNYACYMGFLEGPGGVTVKVMYVRMNPVPRASSFRSGVRLDNGYEDDFIILVMWQLQTLFISSALQFPLGRVESIQRAVLYSHVSYSALASTPVLDWCHCHLKQFYS
jgi:hypothetical protein